jgi:hypothetical protein
VAKTRQQPNQRGKPGEDERCAIQRGQQRAADESFHHQPGPRARVEKSAGQSPLRQGKEQAHHFGASGEINGFPDAQQHPARDEHPDGPGETRQPLGDGPEEEGGGVKPAQIEPVHAKTNGDLQIGVGPEERRKQHSLLSRVQVEIL